MDFSSSVRKLSVNMFSLSDTTLYSLMSLYVVQGGKFIVKIVLVGLKNEIEESSSSTVEAFTKFGVLMTIFHLMY